MPDFEFTLFQYAVAIVCALIFGISKAGIKGIGIIAVPLMAIAFGGKASTGIVLPLLMMGDIFAVWYETVQLNLWLLPGIILGVWLGIKLVKLIKDHWYRQLILWMTLLGAVLLLI